MSSRMLLITSTSGRATVAAAARTEQVTRSAVTAPSWVVHAKSNKAKSRVVCKVAHSRRDGVRPLEAAAVEATTTTEAAPTTDQGPAGAASSNGTAADAGSPKQQPADLTPEVLQELTRPIELPQQYAEAEEALQHLLLTDDLDARVAENGETTRELLKSVELAVQLAMIEAYGAGPGAYAAVEEFPPFVAAAHLFLQRVLYRINRLNFFWFDDPTRYQNDRSLVLAALRQTLEAVWQRWEDAALDQQPYRNMGLAEIRQGLVDRYKEDVDPDLGPDLAYVRDAMSARGYALLLAVGSLDGLVEASRQSRVCGGVGNKVSCAVFKVLLEEYGAGRLDKKHSTFFATMLRELGLSAEPEAYLGLVPWQVLASINHNFYLTETRRHYLRYNGGLSFFEINGPSVYRAYLGAARRNGLSEAACGYWELHIREDERHGRQMLDDVALGLVDRYPDFAWEVVYGYDQEKRMGQRAGAAVAAAIKQAEARTVQMA